MIKKFISFYKPYKLLFILDLVVALIASFMRFGISSYDKGASK